MDRGIFRKGRTTFAIENFRIPFLCFQGVVSDMLCFSFKLIKPQIWICKIHHPKQFRNTAMFLRSSLIFSKFTGSFSSFLIKVKHLVFAFFFDSLLFLPFHVPSGLIVLKTNKRDLIVNTHWYFLCAMSYGKGLSRSISFNSHIALWILYQNSFEEATAGECYVRAQGHGFVSGGVRLEQSDFKAVTFNH